MCPAEPARGEEQERRQHERDEGRRVARQRRAAVAPGGTDRFGRTATLARRVCGRGHRRACARRRAGGGAERVGRDRFDTGGAPPGRGRSRSDGLPRDGVCGRRHGGDALPRRRHHRHGRQRALPGDRLARRSRRATSDLRRGRLRARPAGHGSGGRRGRTHRTGLGRRGRREPRCCRRFGRVRGVGESRRQSLVGGSVRPGVHEGPRLRRGGRRDDRRGRRILERNGRGRLHGRGGLRRRSGRARGQERERIHVPVRVGGDPDAQVHVRDGPLRLARRPRGADDGALGEHAALRDGDRAQVGEGHGVTVAGEDRHRQPVGCNRPGEGDAARGRGADGLAGPCGDVDAAMLTGRVRVGDGRERLQDGAVERPAPARGDGHGNQGDGGNGGAEDQAHRARPQEMSSEHIEISSLC